MADATASISYSSSADLTNLSPVPLDSYQHIDDVALVPISVEAQLPPATRTIEIEADFNTMDDGKNHATLNGVTFNHPKVPSAFTQVEFASQNISEHILVHRV